MGADAPPPDETVPPFHRKLKKNKLNRVPLPWKSGKNQESEEELT